MNESLSLQSDILAQDSFLTSINLVKESLTVMTSRKGRKLINKQLSWHSYQGYTISSYDNWYQYAKLRGMKKAYRYAILVSPEEGRM